MERILVSVDGSPSSLKAVTFAELVLLTVGSHTAPVLDPGIEEYARIEHIRAPAGEYSFAAAQSVLDDAGTVARGKGARRIATEFGVGDPAVEIVAAAKNRRADLVVVGSRGHGRVAGLLLGSVAQKVITLAPCPVTVVR
jgi:nucleotide-binding universal stress UspA family protein